MICSPAPAPAPAPTLATRAARCNELLGVGSSSSWGRGGRLWRKQFQSFCRKHNVFLILFVANWEQALHTHTHTRHETHTHTDAGLLIHTPPYSDTAIYSALKNTCAAKYAALEVSFMAADTYCWCCRKVCQNNNAHTSSSNYTASTTTTATASTTTTTMGYLITKMHMKLRA